MSLLVAMWVTMHVYPGIYELDPCFPGYFGQLGKMILAGFERFFELTCEATCPEVKNSAAYFDEIS